MLPVEIVPVDGNTLVLRARGSELLILPHHIGALKSCSTPREFTTYFLAHALLNRPARKLFEAWLRKDKTLWQRVYRTIHNDMEAVDTKPASTTSETETTPSKEENKQPSKKAPIEKQSAKPSADKDTKPSTEKKSKKTTKKKKSSSSTTKSKKSTKTKKTTKSATSKKKKVTKKAKTTGATKKKKKTAKKKK